MIGNISKKFLDVLSKIKTVYFHGGCPDGIGARQILREYFEDSVTYIPFYFQEMNEIPKNSLFIDCSPKNLRMVLEGGGIIMEHHDSRKEELVALLKEFPDQIVFGEGSESGAYLAYCAVNRHIDISYCEEIVYLLAISDTWQKEDPLFDYARMVAGYVVFFGNDFNLSLYQLKGMEDTIRAHGLVQQRKQAQFAKDALKLPKLKVAFINDMNMSGAAEILRNDGFRIIVGFSLREDKGAPTVFYSLRSDATFDSGSFCKANGGGGHKAAAGFSVPYAVGIDPIGKFLDILDKSPLK